MKKYIRAVICLTFSLIKFSLIKLLNFSGFKFSALNIISPFVEFEIGKRAKLILGKRVRMRSGTKVRVRNGAQVNIGENTFLNHGCMVISHERIILGKNVQCGPNVLIYDHDHDFRTKNGLKELKYKTSPIEIGDNVWIGANTVILRGTIIGSNCVVAAGSIIKGVFKDDTIIMQKRDTTVIESTVL